MIMTTTGNNLEVVNNQELNLYYTQLFKGRGGWNIICEVVLGKGDGYVGGATKTFTTYTTDTLFIDLISDLKADDASSDQIQREYHEHFYYKIEDSIAEWLDGLAENIQEN